MKYTVTWTFESDSKFSTQTFTNLINKLELNTLSVTINENGKVKTEQFAIDFRRVVMNYIVKYGDRTFTTKELRDVAGVPRQKLVDFVQSLIGAKFLIRSEYGAYKAGPNATEEYANRPFYKKPNRYLRPLEGNDLIVMEYFNQSERNEITLSELVVGLQLSRLEISKSLIRLLGRKDIKRLSKMVYANR